ncbi:MAG: response regulator [Desulfobacterales bacterium]|nr:response regulator [Desulfobacterales bacterium]
MRRKVLIVDDDKALLHLLRMKFEKFNDQFITLTAENGKEAEELLKSHSISLVVTDLQMPHVDGFALLALLTKNYPDIPVIVMTAHGRTKTEAVVKSKGAARYIEKPVVVETLAKEIIEELKRESEGGSLHNASLEMFIQLIEMEQKTCTIRVTDKKSEKFGVLFFIEGDLYNARINDLQGVEAAYVVFSWDQVSIAIENDCPSMEKKIEDDLQGILLEAMRLKDEAAAGSEEAFAEEGAEHAEAIHEKDEPTEIPIELLIQNKFESEFGENNWLKEINKDNSWDNLINAFQAFGNIFDSGLLKAAYIKKGQERETILMPIGKETVAISVYAKCDTDRLIQELIS